MADKKVSEIASDLTLTSVSDDDLFLVAHKNGSDEGYTSACVRGSAVRAATTTTQTSGSGSGVGTSDIVSGCETAIDNKHLSTLTLAQIQQAITNGVNTAVQQINNAEHRYMFIDSSNLSNAFCDELEYLCTPYWTKSSKTTLFWMNDWNVQKGKLAYVNTTCEKNMGTSATDAQKFFRDSNKDKYVEITYDVSNSHHTWGTTASTYNKGLGWYFKPTVDGRLTLTISRCASGDCRLVILVKNPDGVWRLLDMSTEHICSGDYLRVDYYLPKDIEIVVFKRMRVSTHYGISEITASFCPVKLK